MWHHQGFIREARAFDSLWSPGSMKTGEQSVITEMLTLMEKGTACQTALGP